MQKETLAIYWDLNEICIHAQVIKTYMGIQIIQIIGSCLCPRLVFL